MPRNKYSGGAILDLLIHDIDQALSFFGQPLTISALSDGDVDTMRGVLEYSSGLKVHIEGGWYPPEVPFSASFQITCSHAGLVFSEGKLRLTLAGNEQAIDLPGHEDYVEQITYFVECCENNSAPDLCPPTESAQAVEIATLLKASRRQNGKKLLCAV